MSTNSIVVFDIDGTLTDSVAQHQKAFEKALRSFAFPALRTDWAVYRHHSDSGTFEGAWEEAGWSQQPDHAALEERFRLEFDAVLETDPVAPISGAAEFLVALRQTDWIPVFATGSLRHGALRKLTSLNVAFDEELLVTASEYPTREEIVSHAILRAKEKYSIACTERVVSIGDGIWDLKTAQNLGLEFLGIGFADKAERFRALGARVYPGFGDGLAILADANPFRH
ncbi:HAD family hydrolase [Rhizobium multihospitium]|uniref:phosphoglycolate phosphatase n=1 Tax=Rhizobium multihospitium TaxID=410764 RepID=A0A1C3VXC0_9HYPH|nr:HAD family hydrolase [Rhizobium multihospitium]SCB32318.1 Phosphoglycolate phosphatase, HAD superfamily [Rhizobium multihospitium]